MQQSRTVLPRPRVESPRHLPLVDLLVDARTELFELAVRSGLKVLETMLEEDRTAICGPRYAHVADRAAAYRKLNDLAAGTPVPVDAVTASGSGLDPAISVANARLQAPRIARARGLTPQQVDQAIAQHTQGRQLGFLGEATVNVLELNLALDRLK